jgi:hypothetical protein
MGGMKQDSFNTNLMNRELIERTDQADQEARVNGLSGDIHSQYVTNKLYEHVNEIIVRLKENNPDKFGASAPAAAVQRMYHKLKGKDENNNK